MNAPTHRAAFIVGSCRPPATSTSEMLARELGARLGVLDVACSYHPVARIFRPGPTFDAFWDRLAHVDLLGLATPVYMDALPYPVMALLEALAPRLAERARPRALVAVANCGFPEADHTRVALSQARCFARQTGLAWRGGLGLGAGEMLHGRPLQTLGGMSERIRESLDLAAGALAAGEPVPEAAVELMARPLLAPPLYRWAGAAGWFVEAARNHALTKLWARPFASAEER